MFCCVLLFGLFALVWLCFFVWCGFSSCCYLIVRVSMCCMCLSLVCLLFVLLVCLCPLELPMWFPVFRLRSPNKKRPQINNKHVLLCAVVCFVRDCLSLCFVCWCIYCWLLRLLCLCVVCLFILCVCCLFVVFLCMSPRVPHVFPCVARLFPQQKNNITKTNMRCCFMLFVSFGLCCGCMWC